MFNSAEIAGLNNYTELEEEQVDRERKQDNAIIDSSMDASARQFYDNSGVDESRTFYHGEPQVNKWSGIVVYLHGIPVASEAK